MILVLHKYTYYIDIYCIIFLIYYLQHSKFTLRKTTNVKCTYIKIRVKIPLCLTEFEMENIL